MNVRLARLEHIIEIALPQYCNIEAPALANSEPPSSTRRRRSVSTAADDDNRSHSEEHDPSGGGSFQAGKWYGTSVSGSVAPASVLEQARMLPPSSRVASLTALHAAGERRQPYIEPRGQSPRAWTHAFTAIESKRS
jgi:hypothetical protein